MKKIAATLVALTTITGTAEGQEAYLRVVDVGNGLCVIAREPSGRTMLYDAGHSGDFCPDAVREVVGTGPLDLVVLSHSDSDHISEAKLILDRYGARRILHPGDARSGTTLQAVRDEIGKQERAGADVISLATNPPAFGTTYALGDANVTFVAGWSDGAATASPSDPALPDSDRRNGLSIVVRFEYGGHSVLLTGDTIGRRRNEPHSACRNAERIMASGTVPVDSDILVGQHHGGDNSTSNCFIRAVSPTYVIFSAGSGHGHPSQRVADRLVANGVDPDRIFRTDRGEEDSHEGQWITGVIAGCKKRPGDDDVEMRLPADPAKPLQVSYRSRASRC